MPSVLKPWDFASLSIVVSNISSVFAIFPVKSISMKSFFCIVMIGGKFLTF